MCSLEGDAQLTTDPPGVNILNEFAYRTQGERPGSAAIQDILATFRPGIPRVYILNAREFRTDGPGAENVQGAKTCPEYPERVRIPWGNQEQCRASWIS